MSLLQNQDHASSGRLPGNEASCTALPASGRGAGAVARSYLRAAGPVLRGPAGVAVAVAAFALAAAVGGRGGLAVASTYVAVAGTYCLLNFLHCRETHCGVTGPGWLLAAGLGLAAVLAPGTALSWYQSSAEAAVYLVVLAAGYTLERAVVRRTGRRAVR